MWINPKQLKSSYQVGADIRFPIKIKAGRFRNFSAPTWGQALRGGCPSLSRTPTQSGPISCRVFAALLLNRDSYKSLLC